jgi:hypothetical protein
VAHNQFPNIALLPDYHRLVQVVIWVEVAPVLVEVHKLGCAFSVLADTMM